MIDNKWCIASRVSYEMTVGPIPDGLFVMHSCDNRKCVRPSHLSVGTHLANMRSMVVRGRSKGGGVKGRPAANKGTPGKNKGERNGMAVLTVESVRLARHLRSEGWSIQAIADHIGNLRETVGHAVRGSTWGHLE